MRATALNCIAALLALSPLARCGQPHDEISFSCVPLTTQLSDPIMYPGTVSDHTHLVTGGTAFQRSMAEDTARKANGTTCGVDIDRSNYWVPHMYHRMHNGSFELMENQGISLYYMNRACNYTTHATECDTKNHVPLAPPAGLRMVAGNPFLRTYNESNMAQEAISHMCIGKDSESSETKHLPRQPCTMMRSQVFFPSCWDGENLDSKDHQSHMAYPETGHYNKGGCPKSHPVAIISIFIEFIFNTEPFPDYENWVYAMGDDTGYGLHGDFINGWTDQEALQNALETCTGEEGLESDECSITKNQKRALTPVSEPLEVECPKEDVGQNGPVAHLPGKRHPNPPPFPPVPPHGLEPPKLPGFPGGRPGKKPETTGESNQTTRPDTTGAPTKANPTGPNHTGGPEPTGGFPGSEKPWWADIGDLA